jgi:hypothetical protein
MLPDKKKKAVVEEITSNQPHNQIKKRKIVKEVLQLRTIISDIDRWRQYHHNEGERVLQLKEKGATICKNYLFNGFCILEDGLGEKIKDLQFMKCSLKGVCQKKKKCVNACRRFAAYKEVAHELHYKKRTSIPICITLWIEFLYGISKTKFKK